MQRSSSMSINNNNNQEKYLSTQTKRKRSDNNENNSKLNASLLIEKIKTESFIRKYPLDSFLPVHLTLLQALYTDSKVANSSSQSDDEEDIFSEIKIFLARKEIILQSNIAREKNHNTYRGAEGEFVFSNATMKNNNNNNIGGGGGSSTVKPFTFSRPLNFQQSEISVDIHSVNLKIFKRYVNEGQYKHQNETGRFTSLMKRVENEIKKLETQMVIATSNSDDNIYQQNYGEKLSQINNRKKDEIKNKNKNGTDNNNNNNNNDDDDDEDFVELQPLHQSWKHIHSHITWKNDLDITKQKLIYWRRLLHLFRVTM